jgi:hypothetical protein
MSKKKKNIDYSKIKKKKGKIGVSLSYNGEKVYGKSHKDAVNKFFKKFGTKKTEEE